MDSREISELSKVEQLLRYAADTDHYCEERNCSIDNPQCREMHTKAALAKLQSAMDPPHVSLQPNRLSNDPERIYLEEWQRRNVRDRALNEGFTLLEWILHPLDDRKRRPQRVTHRDAEVAASLIQWLGTSSGLSFMRFCEQQIEKVRAQRAEWNRVVNFNQDAPSQDEDVAALLAGRVHGHPGHSILVREISAALSQVRKQAVREALEKIAS